MIDDVDAANEVSEILTTHAVRKRKPEVAVRGTGRCLSCGHKLPKTRRWCNAECRDEFEVENGH